jgi:hypothetical protein
MSDVVPAVNGTMIVTGRAGQACAMAGWCAHTKVIATTAAKHPNARSIARIVVPPQNPLFYVVSKSSR